MYALLYLPTEVRSQRAWFLDPLRSVGMDFNGLDMAILDGVEGLVLVMLYSLL